ncbi:DNA adenine methylase [Dictyobacter aurantiacus]|uniref:DNA methyltransferase n=1 Tax=Dictyobacter aurantiacus TaxID=1936993 RepID=A0A401ZGZ5_9CHLR|nr:DNA adenine methylase [Dictyobacter aurantiacus]GCE06129.1 DNA methyltransferase [Dictyobacter aurantiacus]
MEKKPFAWYGGKSALVPTLLSLLPTHQVYCEVFGGSGALLFGKSPSPIEIFNDVDSGVVNFFRVLRNPQQAEALQALLQLTPYAREEYYDCLRGWQEAPDPVEKARQWYCAVMQSMNGSIRATGWSSSKKPGSNPAQKWSNHTRHLKQFAHRLSKVQIDHRDFEQVIQAYDGPETCFYLDPPYLVETRKKAQCYTYEMSTADHQRLLACIQQVKGMVILSGYEHPLYKEALTGWDCKKVTVSCSAENRSSKQEILPQTMRNECIWRNPLCVQEEKRAKQVLLFSDEAC